MTVLLQTLDEIQSGTPRDLASLLREDGRRVGWQGDQRPSPRYLSQLAEAARLVAAVARGNRRAMTLFQEAMSTSDFPLLFGDILSRTLLSAYAEYPSEWRAYTRVVSVPDFRQVKLFTLDGAESTLEEVPELTAYPARYLTEAENTLSVKKYGARMPFSWETMINDDLNALTDIPQRFGRAGRRSEQKFVTQLYVDASGPHASLYTAGNGNIINATNSGGPFTGVNPPLSIEALQQAFVILSQMVDSDGEPIFYDMIHLVVPPALELTARNILNATELRITTGVGGGSATGTEMIAANWMRGRVQVHVDPYIPIVASTANGNTSWFLFADPNTSRPALIAGFLAGRESPELFIKDPNARRIGGGDVNPMDGDFDTDSIEYKVRHVFGGARQDAKATVASNGSGS